MVGMVPIRERNQIYLEPDVLRDTIVKLLKPHRVSMPPSSRFDRAIRVLERHETMKRDATRLGVADWRVHYEAEDAVQQLLLILLHPIETGYDVWRQRLSVIIKGSELPERDAASSEARNAQFELLVAATSDRSGFNPEMREPDLVIHPPGWGETAVAIKRVRSPRVPRVRDNLRSACKQIRREGHQRSLIAIQGFMSFKEARELLWRGKGDPLELAERFCDRFTSLCMKQLKNLKGGRPPGLIGCLGHLLVRAHVGSVGVVHPLSSWQLHYHGADDGTLTGDFMRAFDCAPGPNDLDAPLLHATANTDATRSPTDESGSV